MSSAFGSFGLGLLLGLSVAWPPGPINAEMLRRALERGFWPAASVGLGASAGDFFWALGVALATEPLRRLAALEGLLAGTSAVLLFWLGVRFLRSGLQTWRLQQKPLRVAPVDSSRGGFFLGLALALSSPWNLAFWLGVLGQGDGSLRSGGALAVASGVVVAAALWSFFWSALVRLLGRGLGFRWAVASQLLTGLVMLWFAGQAIRKGWLLFR